MSECPIKYTNFQVFIYEGDCGVFPVIKNKCELIKYKNNYHVSLVAGATGDPTLSSNTDFSNAMSAGEAMAFIAKNCADGGCCPVAFDTSGDTLTITLSDGTTLSTDITHPSVADDVHVTGVTIAGDVLTITSSDGSTVSANITHPALPDDVHVTGFDISGDTVTITLSNGTVLTDTVEHPSGGTDANKFITDAVIDVAAGTITYTYNDGTTFVKPHPAGGGGSDTNHTLTSPNGTIDIGGSNSTNYTVDVNVDGCSVKANGAGELEAHLPLYVNDTDMYTSGNIGYDRIASGVVTDTFPNGFNQDSHPAWIEVSTTTIPASAFAGKDACDNAVILQAECIAGLHFDESVDSLIANPTKTDGLRTQSRIKITGNGITRTTKAGYKSNDAVTKTVGESYTVPFNADGSITIVHEYRTNALDALLDVHTFANASAKIIGYERVRN